MPLTPCGISFSGGGRLHLVPTGWGRARRVACWRARPLCCTIAGRNGDAYDSTTTSHATWRDPRNGHRTVRAGHPACGSAGCVVCVSMRTDSGWLPAGTGCVGSSRRLGVRQPGAAVSARGRRLCAAFDQSELHVERRPPLCQLFALCGEVLVGCGAGSTTGSDSSWRDYLRSNDDPAHGTDRARRRLARAGVEDCTAGRRRTRTGAAASGSLVVVRVDVPLRESVRAAGSPLGSPFRKSVREPVSHPPPDSCCRIFSTS